MQNRLETYLIMLMLKLLLLLFDVLQSKPSNWQKLQ